MGDRADVTMAAHDVSETTEMAGEEEIGCQLGVAHAPRDEDASQSHVHGQRGANDLSVPVRQYIAPRTKMRAATGASDPPTRHSTRMGRHLSVTSARPGELLCQDAVPVELVTGVVGGAVHVVVDVYDGHAFGLLSTAPQLDAAVTILDREVLPCYRDQGLPVGAVITGNGWTFCGADAHPYPRYLILNGIEHRIIPSGYPRVVGVMERFIHVGLKLFFRNAFPTRLHTSVDTLQIDLDIWLAGYNARLPHPGPHNR